MVRQLLTLARRNQSERVTVDLQLSSSMCANCATALSTGFRQKPYNLQDLAMEQALHTHPFEKMPAEKKLQL
ncbi:hypothetical protein DaAHT2_2655 [Desulfurivibrio alkaliphilus AHT 2]|uniref:Uncharacterized protein n=1 Tax=Desulfurivibrio alkaliphilus (strain DSM 19089 / UNIQEM U267 / AHT2) TaxID=589865 RepID=D6Z1I1_DESAT|nr:hypothetical protein DaAHT2_2655 [Desulfurivibrio alkaliphilus AHT 2]